MTDELKPKFGDRLVNTVASARNPHREGIFVRAKRITGRFNPGLWFEMTDGNGEFWTSSAKFMAPAHPAPAGEPQMPEPEGYIHHEDACGDVVGPATPYYTADQLRAYGDARAEAARREDSDGLRAARIAYASEFPLNADGEPDVGSIHANIRALKAEVQTLREQAQTIATKDQQLVNLLQHCPDAECMTCGEIMCPHGEPLHFHHDGCPACYQQENTRDGAAQKGAT